MNYFITGTDTDCGKTYVTALLVRAARAQGKDVVGAKPFCCGSRGDVEALAVASGGVKSLEALNPVWLQTPAAPRACEMLGEAAADVARAVEGMRVLSARHEGVLCEGAGGWLVPVAFHYTMADFAVELGWPVILVARNRLGVLNHTLLTVESVRARGMVVAGIILNSMEKIEEELGCTNRAILEECGAGPILGEIGLGQTELEVSTGLMSGLWR